MLDYEKFQKIHDFFIQGRTDLALRLLMQIQAQHISLHDTIDVLKARIQEFEKILYKSSTLHFDGRFYWLRSKTQVQGPFCPHCYEGDNVLFKLSEQENIHFCNHCGSDYEPGAHAVGDTLPHAKLPSAKLIPFKSKS